LAGSVTNIANATGTYDGNKPVKSNDATATVTKIASTGQICPTQTTCGQYMSGTAAVLTKASYNSKTGTIKSVFPGVMFYYSTIISNGTVMTISVDQSNSGGWPVMAIQDTKQVMLYSSSCTKIAGTKVEVSGSKVTLTTKTKLPAGTYLLGH
jgi:hypothetical protein